MDKRPPVGKTNLVKPRQKRSQASLDRLLTAAEELLEEKEFDAISVIDIVQRAKSSVGVFYSRFREKDELLIALDRRLAAEMLVATESLLAPDRWSGIGLSEILRSGVSFIVEIYRSRRRLARPLVARMGVNPSLRSHWIPFHHQIADRLSALLATRLGEIRHPEPRLGVDFGLDVVFTFMDRLVVSVAPTSGMTLDDPRLEAELTRLAIRYIGIDDGTVDTSP